ncbi:hypothetical protein N7470_003251 [Penicillium chermesinum]|nr:hypothetical protein N7470_003251 [Penicillium chermesinum]
MPPRVQSRRVSSILLPYLAPSSASIQPSSCPSQILSRQFSATSAPQTKLRREMFAWLNTEGAALKDHVPGETNYLPNPRNFNETNLKPFPHNDNFISESILSEELRNEIYTRVVKKKRSVRAVSVELGVEMKRIAAVVRLVELEQRQRAQGKPLALPYARAVHEMVPTTRLAEKGERQAWHEPINDLPAHPATGAQIFYPVPESRSFTRVDAGRVFSAAPALENERREAISHPSDLAEDVLNKKPGAIEMVGKGDNAREMELDRIAFPEERRQIVERNVKRIARQDEIEKSRREKAEAWRERSIRHIEPEGGRFDFRFQNVEFSKQTTGANGRSHKAPGRRYGVPNQSHKRGVTKIPTRVEA